MSKHTPGPWTVEHYGDGDSLVLHSDVNTRICFMATPGSSPRAFPQIEANARLISAAPCLLEALKELDAVLGDTPMPDCGTMNRLITASSNARAAIAKAVQQ